jgi:THO complex subunit 2
MNRLSKDSIKIQSRNLGKVAHSNPTLVFNYILSQLENKPNMIPLIAETGKYFTDLELDVWSYCLINSLSKPGRKKVELNGTTFEQWIKNLSTFLGSFFRRNNVDLEGILKYIINQFSEGEIEDVLIFQELIAGMTGITSTEDVTELQLEVISGGKLIRKEALVVENSRQTQKASTRLTEAIAKNQLVIPFAIVLAQHRSHIVSRLTKNDGDYFNLPNLKVIAWQYDLV